MDAAVVALLTGLLGFWLGGHLGERKLQRIREGMCGHSWLYHSLYQAGEFWNRTCRICGRWEIWREDPPCDGKLSEGEKPLDCDD